MNKILIKGGMVIDSLKSTMETKDILIKDGIIEEVSPKIDVSDALVIDAKNKHISPGFIDLNSHICESWQEVESSIESGTKSALKGGFTTICAMSNTNPPLDNEGMIGIIKFIAEKKGWTNVIPAACATKGLNGESISEIGNLISVGAGLIFDAGKTTTNVQLLRRIMEYTKMFNVPLFLHCEEVSLTEGGLINEGEVSTRLGLPGIPSVSEDIIVARDLLLAEYLNVRIHFPKVSTANSVSLIRNAKKNGIKVTASTTAYHLDLTENDILDFNTNFKVRPPLRSEEDRKALIKGIEDGTIDAIVSDHNPCSMHSKSVEFAKAPFGIVTLENVFQICYERLVKKNGISLPLMIQRLTSSPAQILGLESGFIQKGSVADLCVLDLTSGEKIMEETLVSKCKNTPYLGTDFNSKISACFVKGILKYNEGQFFA